MSDQYDQWQLKIEFLVRSTGWLDRWAKSAASRWGLVVHERKRAEHLQPESQGLNGESKYRYYELYGVMPAIRAVLATVPAGVFHSFEVTIVMPATVREVVGPRIALDAGDPDAPGAMPRSLH